MGGEGLTGHLGQAKHISIQLQFPKGIHWGLAPAARLVAKGGTRRDGSI